MGKWCTGIRKARVEVRLTPKHFSSNCYRPSFEVSSRVECISDMKIKASNKKFIVRSAVSQYLLDMYKFKYIYKFEIEIVF